MPPATAFGAVVVGRFTETVDNTAGAAGAKSAEARNAARNVSRKRRTFEGDVRAGEVDESARLDLDGAYDGAGEISRSESLVTQMSVLVEDVLANGDLRVAGVQQMRVNGETTTVRVRGRVRPTDISGDNRVLSTRIADAEIDYGGRGFVSRSARPGFVHRVFSLLGLGG